jgi:hypothetical protein
MKLNFSLPIVIFYRDMDLILQFRTKYKQRTPLMTAIEKMNILAAVFIYKIYIFEKTICELNFNPNQPAHHEE